MVDFDFENCHYAILNYYCKEHQLAYESIEYFVNNRDKVMNTLINVYENTFSRSTLKRYNLYS